MKKIITICMFAVTLYLHGQEEKQNETSGLMRVYRDGYVGYVDENGKEVITPIYENIVDAGNISKTWVLVGKNGLLGIVDHNGVEILPPEYEMIGQISQYPEGWFITCKNGHYNYVDSNGRETLIQKEDTDTEAIQYND